MLTGIKRNTGIEDDTHLFSTQDLIIQQNIRNGGCTVATINHTATTTVDSSAIDIVAIIIIIIIIIIVVHRCRGRCRGIVGAWYICIVS